VQAVRSDSVLARGRSRLPRGRHRAERQRGLGDLLLHRVGRPGGFPV